MIEKNRRTSIGLQGVLVGILIGLLWKWSFFRFADVVYTQIPLTHEFFPDFLRVAWVAKIAYLVGVAGFATSLVAVTFRKRWNRFRTATCATGTLASAVLLVHQATYNDVTFLIVVWSGGLAAWYSHRLSCDEAAVLLDKAAHLSRVVISLMFLGGLIGKCTAEYWSGQVLYEIYFVDRDFWFFNFLRERYHGEALRSIATTYSRLVIVTEAVGALAWGAGWVMSSRIVAALSIVILVGIGVMSNFQLFSVLAPLIGLAGLGFAVPKHPSAQ